MVGESATTTCERRKIVAKLMPFLRAQTILTNDMFAEIGMCVRPVRSWQTVKLIHDRYLRGELWGHWRLSVVPEHEPIRVNRFLQDLRATTPNISLRECARHLGINWSTFRGINAKVATIPPSKIIFSRRNPDFEDIYFSHLRLAREALRLEAFSLTHLGVTGCLIQLAERGVQIFVLLDWCQVLSPFELPCIKQLLIAKECFDVKVYVQRSKNTTQHQKMFIVDNILVTTASANPSMNGLTKSFENLTLHFIAEEVDKATEQFSRDLEEDFFEVDHEWIRTEEQQVSSSRQLAAAIASEGPTAEEIEALDFQLETDDIVLEEVTAIEEFLMEESATVQELIDDAQLENHTNDVRTLPSDFNAPYTNGSTPGVDFVNTLRPRFLIPIHITRGRDRARYRERQCREANICVRCKTASAESGKKQCLTCLIKRRKLYARKVASLSDQRNRL